MKFSLFAVTLLVLGSSPAGLVGKTEPQKVYADYHSARYTREHDGALGIWKYSTVGKNSRLPNPVVNRNADLIDESGRHELASADYPLVGMQSELDPDYIEYQVLSAKAAHIDGFFVEWGFFDHGSERIRRALTTAAAHYDFEIGINLCDRWLFQQLPAMRPELRERDQLVEAFIKNYRQLLRTIDAERVTARFKGQPVIFLFGDGLSPGEFDHVNQAVAAAQDPAARVLIRPRLTAKLGANSALVQSWESAPWFEPGRGFRSGVSGFFSWVPTRARPGGAATLEAQFDRHGTIDDSLEYLKQVMAAKGSGPRVSSATPGFDNRSCAGWGNDFSLLVRGQGELYRDMWKFNVANARNLDWVFVPTWNDWTEGSQIEPSVEDQGLALKLTAVAAARFKGLQTTPELIELPLRLFKLRKRAERLERIGLPDMSSVSATLDQAAMALARHDPDAAKSLGEAETFIAGRERVVPQPERLILVGNTNGVLAPFDGITPGAPPGCSIQRLRLDEDTADKLRKFYYEAMLEFDFKPTRRGKLEVLSDTDRPKSEVGDFGVIADINLLEAGDWQRARVRVFARNCAWLHRLPGGNDLEFRGAAEVRNVRLSADLIRPAP